MFQNPEYKPREQNDFYDDTPNSGEEGWKWQQQVYDYAYAVAEKINARSVVDAGCGSGVKLVEGFADMTTIGMDVQPTLGWLQEQYPGRLWLESNLDDSFRPPHADIAVSSDVIEHIPNPDIYMRMLRRVCAYYYIMSTPDRNDFHSTHKMAQDGPPDYPGHVREWTHDELAAYVSRSGFRVLDSRHNAAPKLNQNTMWFLLELVDRGSCRQ
eukprot:g1849.t1